MKNKQIHYRSPVRGFEDNLINEPTCVYFGFVERIPVADFSARSNEITADGSTTATSVIVDGVIHVLADDRQP